MHKICVKRNHILVAIVVLFVLSILFFSYKAYQSKTSYYSRASVTTNTLNNVENDSLSSLQSGTCYADMDKKTIVSCNTSYPEVINLKAFGKVVNSYNAMVYRFCPENDEQGHCQYVCVDIRATNDQSDDRIRHCSMGQENPLRNSNILIHNTSDEKIKISQVKVTEVLDFITYPDEIAPDFIEVEPKSFIRYRLKYAMKPLRCEDEPENVIDLDVSIHYRDMYGEYKEKVAVVRVKNQCRSIDYNGLVYISVP